MTVAPKQIEALVHLGYTREEARFIYIVAIHSGYFTHRQFLQFADINPGKHSHKFVEKLLGQKHASAHNYRCGARVYHIFSRKVFHAIGHDNLRTRRKHQLDYIKTRLMALDFVLANPGVHYLETETDKVLFFEDRFQVRRSLLPSRTYTSNVSSQSTTRYFVDRLPLYIEDAQSSSPLVTLTYLDPGFATESGFATHLRDYSGLLGALGQFRLVYVGLSEDAFPAVELEFSRVMAGGALRPTKEALLRYFALRKTWEGGGRVEAADVVFLNAARKQFAREAVESLYRKWTQGAVRAEEFDGLFRQEEGQIRGVMTTVLGGESLSIFRSSNEEPDRIGAGKSGEPLSPQFSPQVSQS